MAGARASLQAALAAGLAITITTLLLAGLLTHHAAPASRIPDYVAPAYVADNKEPCSPAIVDWSQFNAAKNPTPGNNDAGKAALLVEDYQDPGLPWLIAGLQALKYKVTLLAVAGSMEAAKAFLSVQGDATANTTTPIAAQDVTLQEVTVHGSMLDTPMVQVFAQIPTGATALVAGRGAVNLLLMPAPGHAHSGGYPGRTDYPDATTQSQQGHLNVTRSHDAMLATYDYLLSWSVADSTAHLRALIPAFERLQQRNTMFPIFEVLPVPLIGPEVQVDPHKAASSGPVSPIQRTQAKLRQVIHRANLSKVIRFFMQSSLAAYRSRITPAVQRHRDENARMPPDGKQYAAVIVEARPSSAFLYTVLNAAWYLPGWRLHVVHSRTNAGFVRRILEPHLNVTHHMLSVDNIDIDAYNRLMKSSSFWQMFDADYVLLFQTDSLILRQGIEAFARFDYIGAPWHQNNERWSQPALRAALPAGVGNGGFSLRSVKAMVELCDTFAKDSPLKEQEDVFFAVKVHAYDVYKLADRQSAYSFCMEVPCVDLPATQPHALHAAWYYNNLPTLQRLLDSSLYDLGDCTRLG